RFIMMNMPDGEIAEPSKDALESVDKWILSKCNSLIKEVTDNMEKYELGIAVQKVYDFIWDEFCDWYIEMVKPRLYAEGNNDSKNAALWTLKTVCINALKLLHPYMPFVTEEIFTTIQDKEESIMISSWPEYSKDFAFEKEEKAIETIKEAVRAIRNVRTNLNVSPSRKAEVFVVSNKAEVREIFESANVYFKPLAYASNVTVQADNAGIADDAVSCVISGATIYMPFAELVDISAEIERLTKEEARLQGEIKRSNGMLSNEKFIAKAPEAKVNEEKEKLKKYEEMLKEVTERLASLKK
ncbi:MAG: class I tRNA ligase family protein, partial [Lachnospiraceae bacterium]|nr:class I tRNA ligase family protein [Lachnospiraceae bacterium]